jgi:hypothetical protein
MMQKLAMVIGLCAVALPSFAADLKRQPITRLPDGPPVAVVVPVPAPQVWIDWGYQQPYVFLAPTYYESFAGRYRLPPPPPGLQWVRRGRDLALVDPRNGYVADYRDNVFRGSPLY